ncbi:MAG: phosphoenolpyruvate--protein phosphotransferase [Simkaniaceae bacterium]|nr:phosphoenolpyruvate--protein phosphotransferase [Simkaniaceae bacterium]
MSREMLEETLLKGTQMSEGIAIGKLHYNQELRKEVTPESSIRQSGVEKEIRKYRRAILSSREDLQNVQHFLAKEGATEAISIIDTHIRMLDDPLITTVVEAEIRRQLKNTETVFRSVMTDYEKEFSKGKNSLFKQRLIDVKDLSKRILRHLHPRESLKTEDIPKNSIVFVRELTPSIAAQASRWQIQGFITEIGGKTSHAALIARSKRIPYIAHISHHLLCSHKGSLIILDGKTGLIIINPSDATLEKYEKKRKDANRKEKKKVYALNRETKTADGVKVEVLANIENLSDLDLLAPYAAEGIGLCRSECLFFDKKFHTFSEDDQFMLYQQVMEKSKGMPIVFRILDVGGDKGNNMSQYDPETNPALGCRGIRFLLRNRDIFAKQLRAFLRLSLDGDLRVLLPMISDLEELYLAKKMLQATAFQLRSEGYEIADDIPIGCMIEVPSAAYMSHAIARECDFLSIGTNDLIQYTLAADRAMEEVNGYNRSTHPSIFRMILHIIQEAKDQNTPVNLCGEMASDPQLIPFLLGLGIRKFSCVPRRIPEVKEYVAKLSIEKLKSFTEKALDLETACELEAFLQQASKSIYNEKIKSL